MKASPISLICSFIRFAACLVLFSLAIIFAVLAASSAAEEMHTWTSTDGERTFIGRLEAYNPDTGQVTVTYQNGQTVFFDQGVLSQDDLTSLAKKGAFEGEQPGDEAAAGGSGPDGIDPGAVDDGLQAYDGEEADMTKPVQVFILMGQSNMLGFGNVAGGNNGALEHAVKEKELYPHLMDDSGEWVTREDVRNVFVMNHDDKLNSWLSAANNNRGKIGPELGIGWCMGELFEQPVLILKSCIGNRSIGWDLLSPGMEARTVDGKLQPGYGWTPATAGSGEKHQGNELYAGKRWDTDIAGVHRVLQNIGDYYPGAEEYEVAGFAFWQGDKDR